MPNNVPGMCESLEGLTMTNYGSLTGIEEKVLIPFQRMPLLIQASPGNRNLVALASESSAEIQQRLLDHGALLFRGFDVWSPKDFARAVDAIAPRRMEYVYRSTPRTDLGSRIYTATEYPPSQTIALHNENAYQREWPLKLMLCCLKPARSGGQTPIADMRKVTAMIGQQLLNKFHESEVRYVRHYMPHTDIPWQKVFQTDRACEVSAFCGARGMECEWLEEDVLRTSQVCQGVAYHPVTGEKVFFNQAHLFHVSNLGPEGEWALLNQFGYDRLPRHAYFGDGAKIPAEDLQTIRAAFEANAITFRWDASDVLLIDNMQVAHGRQPYSGTRQVIVALLDSSQESRPESCC